MSEGIEREEGESQGEGRAGEGRLGETLGAVCSEHSLVEAAMCF